MMGIHQACERAAQAEPGANACDRYAGDAYDPGKVVPGLSAYCMTRYTEPAIAACRKAVRDFPGEVRFRAQLARALAFSGRFDEARREAGIAQAKGSTLAMTLIGAMEEFGYGGAKNAESALAWYRKAADLGDTRALKLVGSRAMSGLGVAKDSPEAKALIDEVQAKLWKEHLATERAPEDPFTARAEKGDPSAQHSLAYDFEQRKQYDEAIRWYRRAAAQGFDASAMNLAQLYEKGIGVPVDLAAAKDWYRKPMERGNGEALFRLASLEERTDNLAEALALYQRGVRNDDYRAMVALGEMIEHGRGTAKNPAKALAWWQRAADGGDARAHNNLGVMYDRGIGTARDYLRARDEYLLGLSGGVPQAKGNLEDFFEAGRGAPAEPAAAAAWYGSGAEAGVAAAQYRLGNQYANGRGVARDEQEALRWLTAAAEQGHAKAEAELRELLFALGQRHERGEGVTRDLEQAKRYYLQGAALGDRRALERLVEMEERAGNAASAAQLRALLSQPPRRPLFPKPPTGFNLDPGNDEQRERQIRVVGTGMALAAAVPADEQIVLIYIPRKTEKPQ